MSDHYGAAQPIMDWVKSHVYDPVATIGKAINKVPLPSDKKSIGKTALEPYADLRPKLADKKLGQRKKVAGAKRKRVTAGKRVR